MALDIKPPSAVKTHTQGLSLKEKLTSRWPWLQHVTHAYDQYNQQNGGYFAAGMTFSVIMALFPLLMVACGVAGIVLAGRHDLLTNIENRIGIWLSITTHSSQLNTILDAIVARSGTVGIFGLIMMLYGGINFVSGLREAMTHQWDSEKIQENFFIRKLNDLLILTGMYILIILIISFFVLYEIAQHQFWGKIARPLHLVSAPEYLQFLKIVSFFLRYLLIFCLWTYVIARIPRIQLPFKHAYKAGLLMTVLFAILLRMFGYLIVNLENNPVLGVAVSVFALMIFINWTARLLLFCTAWAATAPENQQFNTVPKIPDGVVVTPLFKYSDTEKTRAELFIGGALLGGITTMLGINTVRRKKTR